MTASPSGTVNAILARCLLDPDFLDGVARDPARAIAELPLEDRTRTELIAFDWSKVRAFGGLITKVQHNDLWPVLPYTRALLKACRREIAFFAAYRPTYLRLRANGATRERKIQSFLVFLVESGHAAHCPGVLDVARHEQARWLAGQALSDQPDTTDRGPGVVIPARAAASSERLVPFVRGWLKTVSFTTDPEVAIAAINRGDPLAASASAGRWLGYWIRPGETYARLLELDARAVGVLEAVDGLRRIGSVARRARVGLATTREILRAAQTQGVIGTRAT
jgi:hypothetical protein